MKNIFINFSVKTVFVAFLCFTFGSAIAQTPTSCGNSGSVASPITMSNGSACYSQPDEMQMTIYKIHLCSSVPTAPTTSAAIDLSACVQVFNNSNGAVATLTSSTANNPPQLSGNTITRPALQNGTRYSHTYIEFAPGSTIKASKSFVSSHTGADSSTGSFCWTGSGTIYAWASSVPSHASSCGASSTPGGALVNKLNSLGGTGPFSASANFSNAGSANDVTVNAYLMDASYKLPASGVRDSMGTVVTLGAIYPLPSAITYDKSTQDGLVTSINFSWGTEIFRQSGTTFFMGGPISVKFSPHCKNQGSC